MICNGVLVGLTSWGQSPCGIGTFGAYANMDKLLGFVDSVMWPGAHVTDVTVVSGETCQSGVGSKFKTP